MGGWDKLVKELGEGKEFGTTVVEEYIEVESFSLTAFDAYEDSRCSDTIIDIIGSLLMPMFVI